MAHLAALPPCPALRSLLSPCTSAVIRRHHGTQCGPGCGGPAVNLESALQRHESFQKPSLVRGLKIIKRCYADLYPSVPKVKKIGSYLKSPAATSLHMSEYFRHVMGSSAFETYARQAKSSAVVSSEAF